MNIQVKVGQLNIGQGMPKICIPLTGFTLAELEMETAAALKAGADIIEWRADCYGTSASESLLQAGERIASLAGGVPLLFTQRTVGEGGKSQSTPGQCAENCRLVLQAGFARMVDVEYSWGDEICRAVAQQAEQAGAAVVVSRHYFDRTPPRQEMAGLLFSMQSLGNVIPKLAVMPGCAEDVLALLGATYDFTHATGRPAVSMSMGKLGAVSRMCGEVFGSAITFGSAQNPSAPGQMKADSLRKALELLHGPDA